MEAPVTLASLVVERLGGLGDGMACWNGESVFIAKSAPGDRLEVRIARTNHPGLRGDIVRVLSDGPDRIPAPCPHYAACGGCSLQHLHPGAYRHFKQSLLETAVRKAGYAMPEAARMHFLPPATRRRVEFKLRHDGATRLAYHGARSHELTAIEQCLLLAPQLQALIPKLNAELSAIAGIEAARALQLTLADTGIDALFTGDATSSEPLTESLAALAQRLNITRIAWKYRERIGIIAGRAPLVYAGAIAVVIPPGAFLQPTHEGQATLTGFITEALPAELDIADLFAGIGIYGFSLATHARHVQAFEGDGAMVKAALAAVKQHGLSHRFAFRRRDLFKQPLSARELGAFGALIVNPPRAGAKAQCEQLAKTRVPRVAMISCNPATFSRDAAILRQGGYRLVRILGLDQFAWSAHLEIAAEFQC